jgi:hypothetical protein
MKQALERIFVTHQFHFKIGPGSNHELEFNSRRGETHPA